MRKVILTLALGAFALTSNAQDVDEVASVDENQIVSKKGIPILPQTDDWGLSINGTPFLNAVSNLTGGFTTFGGTNQAFGFINSGTQQIRVKMFKDANTAMRADVNIGYNTSSYTNTLTQAGAASAFPAQDPQVEDKYTRSEMNIRLSAAMEMRRGKGRVQGYYGPMAWIGFGGNTDKFTYGNAYDGTNNPTLSLAGNQSDYTGDLSTEGSALANNLGNIGNSRVTKYTESLGFSIGVGGIIGVEYFFAPKISIGGEMSWGLGFTFGGGKEESEHEVENAGAVTTQTYAEAPGSSSINIGTGNLNGDVLLNFYF